MAQIAVTAAPVEQTPPAVVERRVRNRIIEYLELASSFALQREYQANVDAKAPYVDVPSEVINQWEDWVFDQELDTGYGAPTYTSEEHEAILEFHSVWNDVAERTPDPLPPLAETQRLSEWAQLRDAAEQARNGRDRGLLSAFWWRCGPVMGRWGRGNQ